MLSLSLIPQDGWTALMYASWYNYLKVVEKLLQECAHPDHQSNVSNWMTVMSIVASDAKCAVRDEHE